MIDIHSHIIFDVDDGAKNETESLKLLKESYKQGIHTIIATSHRRKGMFETPEEKIIRNFQRVKELAYDISPDLSILFGAEIYYTDDVLKKLEKKSIPCLAGTGYILIEFSTQISYKEMYTALNRLIYLGFTPILAHAEVYNCLEESERNLRYIIDMGCCIQVNSRSVLGVHLFRDKCKRLKKRARYLLDKNLVHFIASDMHNIDTRNTCMAEAYKVIEKRYGTTRAKALFEGNQQLLLEDELI